MGVGAICSPPVLAMILRPASRGSVVGLIFSLFRHYFRHNEIETSRSERNSTQKAAPQVKALRILWRQLQAGKTRSTAYILQPRLQATCLRAAARRSRRSDGSAGTGY